MTEPRSIEDILESIDAKLGDIPEELLAERRARRWQVWMLTVAMVLVIASLVSVVVVGQVSKSRTLQSRDDSRCAIRDARVKDHATFLVFLRKSFPGDDNAALFAQLARIYADSDKALAESFPATC